MPPKIGTAVQVPVVSASTQSDADEPLSEYADGDHLTGDARLRYTERFAAKHARFLQ